MPSKKITDLDELTTGASGDKLLIVDASDTTDSSEGTSKYIDWDNLPSGGGGGGDDGNANFIVAVSDEVTYLTAGAAKVTFPWPFTAKTITRIRASVTEAPTDSGSDGLDIDINDDGVSILSSTLTIAASGTSAATTSFSGATPARDSVMTIDIDAVTDTLTGKGLKIQFQFD